MGNVFDEELRKRINEAIRKNHSQLFDWVSKYCRDYQDYDYKSDDLQLYPEELAFFIISALNELFFIKSITHLHPSHFSVLTQRIESKFEKVLFVCLPPEMIYLDFSRIRDLYVDSTMSILLTLSKYQEGKPFFHLAWSLLCVQINTEISSNPEKLTFDQSTLDDIESIMSIYEICLADSLWNSCVVHYTIQKTISDQSQSECFEMIMQKLDDISQFRTEIHNHFNAPIGQYAQNIEKQELKN